MIESLRRHEIKEFELFAVCTDEVSRLVLECLELPNIRVLGLHEIEQRDLPLLAAKQNRSHVEYLWTLTPSIILRLLESYQEIDVLTYLDADLYFFSSPQPIFDELGSESVLIHEHRFSPQLKHLEENGKYNVGLLCFRRDELAWNVLLWWRERCIEWCYAEPEDGKMGDQGYLNDWPTRFPGVVVLKHLGAGLGPWNSEQYEYSRSTQGEYQVNNLPIVFYHFHSFVYLNQDVVAPLCFEAYRIPRVLIEACFFPYLNALEESLASVRKVLPQYTCGLSSQKPVEKNVLLFAKKSVVPALAEQGLFSAHFPLDETWECYSSPQLL